MYKVCGFVFQAKSLVCSCCYLLSAGIIGLCKHSWFMCTGDQAWGFRAYQASTQPIELHTSPTLLLGLGKIVFAGLELAI